MRHRKAGRKLGRTSSHRDAMFRNMVTSLLQHGRIETTDAKAKELRRLADHMITLAKRGDLHARRQALSVLKSKAVAHKLFTELRERFLDRNGGYTRVLKKGYRVGDCAPVSIIELIPAEHEKAKKAKKKAAKTEAKPKAQPAATKPEKKEEPAAVETPVEVKEEPVAAEAPIEAKEEEQKPAETEPESEPEKA